MRIAAEEGAQVTVRGGGLSSLCAADGAVMLDLSAWLNTAVALGDTVRVGGGATMNTLLDALATESRVVPVGISGLAGLGLATRGGVGYLTRSLGLTVDFIEEVELVVPGGATYTLSDASTGDEAELWWGVRGCAPSFGVVTSATFRSHAIGPVFVHRAVLPVEALGAYFALAPSLPRDTSISAVVGSRPGAETEPVLFTITVHAGDGDAGVERTLASMRALAARAGVQPMSERTGSYRFLEGVPAMAIPGPDGDEPHSPQAPMPGEPRGFFFGKSRFFPASLDDAFAEIVVEQARAAPTPLCRIDFQQTGGALADVDNEATAFWGRDSEWNVPLNAITADPARDREACTAWGRETMAALAPASIGVYSVELAARLPRDARRGRRRVRRQPSPAARAQGPGRSRRRARELPPDLIAPRTLRAWISQFLDVIPDRRLRATSPSPTTSSSTRSGSSPPVSNATARVRSSTARSAPVTTASGCT